MRRRHRAGASNFQIRSWLDAKKWQQRDREIEQARALLDAPANDPDWAGMRAHGKPVGAFFAGGSYLSGHPDLNLSQGGYLRASRALSFCMR